MKLNFKPITLILASLVLIVSFQNCSESVQTTSQKSVFNANSETTLPPLDGNDELQGDLKIFVNDKDINDCSLNSANLKVIIQNASLGAKGCISYKLTGSNRLIEKKDCTLSSATALSGASGWSYDSVKKEWTYQVSTKDSSFSPGNYRVHFFDEGKEIKTHSIAITNDSGDPNSCSTTKSTSADISVSFKNSVDCGATNSQLIVSMKNLTQDAKSCVEYHPPTGTAGQVLCDTDAKYQDLVGNGEWFFSNQTWIWQSALKDHPSMKPGKYKFYFWDPSSGVRGQTEQYELKNSKSTIDCRSS